MSTAQFHEFLTKFEELPDTEKSFDRPFTDVEIQNAEQMLEITFPPQLRSLMARYGRISFDGNEVLGMPLSPSVGRVGPNVVKTNLYYRDRNDLPSDLLLISEVGDGDMYALDLSVVDDDNEPRVVIWPSPGFESRDELEFVAPQLGSFLLGWVDNLDLVSASNPS